jgi:hypothetical protein
MPSTNVCGCLISYHLNKKSFKSLIFSIWNFFCLHHSFMQHTWSRIDRRDETAKAQIWCYLIRQFFDFKVSISKSNLSLSRILFHDYKCILISSLMKIELPEHIFFCLICIYSFPFRNLIPGSDIFVPNTWKVFFFFFLKTLNRAIVRVNGFQLNAVQLNY